MTNYFQMILIFYNLRISWVAKPRYKPLVNPSSRHTSISVCVKPRYLSPSSRNRVRTTSIIVNKQFYFKFNFKNISNEWLKPWGYARIEANDLEIAPAAIYWKKYKLFVCTDWLRRRRICISFNFVFINS